MRTRTITIYSATDDKTHTATFEPVRSDKYGRTLGWATLQDPSELLRFPVTVAATGNKLGYTVYTVSDWQCGWTEDLNDADDWASLGRIGSGQFVNPSRASSQPVSVRSFDLERK